MKKEGSPFDPSDVILSEQELLALFGQCHAPVDFALTEDVEELLALSGRELELRAFVQKDQRNVVSLMALAGMIWEQRRYVDAIPFLRRLILLTGSVEAKSGLAFALIVRANFDPEAFAEEGFHLSLTEEELRDVRRAYALYGDIARFRWSKDMSHFIDLRCRTIECFLQSA